MKFKDNRQQGKDALRKATVQWLLQAAMMVQSQAVLLAPVGDTGNLRDSVDYHIDESELKGYVGTNVEYAVFVEFGTGEFAENGMGRKGGWAYKSFDGKWYFTYGQAPQPYLRPAFRKNKRAIEALAKQILGGMI